VIDASRCAAHFDREHAQLLSCEHLGQNGFCKPWVILTKASDTLRSVARYYVSDLTHFVDDQGRAVSGPLGKLGRYLGLIVESASLMKEGHTDYIPLLCGNPVRRKRCTGQLTAGHAARDSVEWACPLCGEAGHLTNWSGSEFDLGPAREALAYDGQTEVLVPLDELDAMRRSGRGSRSLRQLMAEAIRVSDRHCFFLAQTRELTRLKEYAAIASDVGRGEDRRLLDRFGARMDALVTTFASFTGADLRSDSERLLN
jgi:hypothetical protein